jgi:prepilin-type N-terminal cleavage/methylation domain-containing protein
MSAAVRPIGMAMSREASFDDNGFTLIELMVVVLVIAILLAIAIPTFLGARSRSQDSVATTSLRSAALAAVATGSVSAVTASSMSGELGELSFVSGPSTGPKVVSVAASGSVLYLAARSDSGQCYGASHDGTTYLTAKVTGTCDAATIAVTGLSAAVTTTTTTSATTVAPTTTTAGLPTLPTPATVTCPTNAGVVTLCVADSTATALTGATLSYYGNGSNWTSAPSPDVNGRISLNLTNGSYTFRLSYAGAFQDKTATVGPGSTLVFQTIATQFSLTNSSGAPTAGATMIWYSNLGQWQSAVTTDSNGSAITQLLPGTYYVRTTFGAAYLDRANVVVAGPTTTIGFTTTATTFSLTSSAGAALAGGTVTWYSNLGAWQTSRGLTGGSITVEVLPGTYYVRATYGASYQDLANVVVSGSSTAVPFTTARVTLKLQTSTGAPIVGGSTTWYSNLGAWQPSLTTDASGSAVAEMLPGTSYVRMSYGGTYQDQPSVTISTPATTITFATAATTFTLSSSTSAPLSGGTVQWYSNGGVWQSSLSLGSGGSATAELLPGSYYVRVTYGASYYDRPSVTVSGATTVAFSTAPVTVALQTSVGTPISGGSVTWYSNLGSWQSSLTTGAAGTVTVEMLPSSIYVRMTYGGTYQDKPSITIASPSTAITYSTAPLTGSATSGGAPISGATFQWYSNGGTWQSSVLTGMNGTVTSEVLPGTYYCRMTANGVQQNQSSVTVPIGGATASYAF